MSYGQNSENNLVFLRGSLYGGLPIEISFHVSDDIEGFVFYGSDRSLEYKLEGEKTDQGYVLYEIGENEVLSGIIELSEDHNTCVWNTTDYSSNIPISFAKKQESTTIDFVSHQSYIAVSFPREDEFFQKKMEGRIRSIIREISENYGAQEVVSGQNGADNRFKKRTIAVNKVTLDSKEILSGHITFFDNQNNDVNTLTYTYDRAKKEMLGLSKIFKKNFDYSFFLKQYINQKKDKMVPLLSNLESKWIKNSSFHYYVLTDSGLKFFNDYNSIFGRKSFIIPYHEVSSSISQKSIANYIKKRQ